MFSRYLSLPIAVLSLLSPAASFGQSPGVEVPAGTPLAVYLDRHIPMKVGQPVEGALVYPVFKGEAEVLPARSVVEGKIVALKADKSRRLRARLRGDFTPYRVPVVEFSSIRLSSGGSLPVTVGEVAAGAPIVRIIPPPPRTGGVFHRAVATAKQAVRDQIEVITGPEKGDRALQALYSNLPYHPQRVETGTAWSFETAAPLRLAGGDTPLLLERVSTKEKATAEVAAAKPDPSTWMIEAYLTEALNSAKTPTGQTIHAVVARPVFNEDKTVAVPAGSSLTGTVIRAKPARRFGRSGTLRFAFTQLTLPKGEPQSVQTTLTGVDTQSAQAMALDSEGQVKPQTNKNVVVPLVLALLATRALHTEEGGSEQAGKNTTGANGFGLVGIVVGAVANSPQLAAGIGYYGTALTVYDRYLGHGKEVVFAKDTRIVVQTTARRSAVLKADAPAVSK